MRSSIFLAAVLAICVKPALRAEIRVSLDPTAEARRAGWAPGDVPKQTILNIIPAPAPSLNLKIVTRAEVDSNWEVKLFEGKADFEVLDSDRGKIFHLRSDKTSYALYKVFPKRFDIKNYPFLRWRWKAVKLPRAENAGERRANNQAISIYVVFPRWPELVNSRLLGYIWDTTAPKGSVMAHPKYSPHIKFAVLRSGAEGLGDWFEETRNVYEDYRKSEFFGEESEPPQVGGVAVMIDSNDTGASAESFIGDIYFDVR